MKKLTLRKTNKIFINYLHTLGYKDKTVKCHKRKVKRFYEYLTQVQGIDDFRNVDEKVLTNFFNWLNEKVSDRTGTLLAASTKKELYSIIKLLFRSLYHGEFILVNPVRNVLYKPGGSTKQRKVLTEEEMSRFLDGIDEDKPFGLRDKALFELMYSSGLRGGDISNLDVCDVDFDARMVLLKDGKFSKDRVVPISRVAVVFLKRYLEAKRRKTNILFTGPRGVRISVSAINSRCKKWLRETGVYRIGFCSHSIRHSTAVHLLSHGADMRYVQELLGHDSIETTVTYTHDLHENIRRVYKSFHPRENLYFQEVTEVYLERLWRFEKELAEQKRISVKKRKIKQRYYEKNRDKILKKMKQEYYQHTREKKDLTNE